MIKICEDCAGYIVGSWEKDAGFYYEFGDISDWHPCTEEVYECENGCENTSFVEVESELGRRFYRRFKTKTKTEDTLIIIR